MQQVKAIKISAVTLMVLMVVLTAVLTAAQCVFCPQAALSHTAVRRQQQLG